MQTMIITSEKKSEYESGTTKWVGQRVTVCLNGVEVWSQLFNFYDVDEEFTAQLLFRKVFEGIEV